MKGSILSWKYLREMKTDRNAYYNKIHIMDGNIERKTGKELEPISK